RNAPSTCTSAGCARRSSRPRSRKWSRPCAGRATGSRRRPERAARPRMSGERLARAWWQTLRRLALLFLLAGLAGLAFQQPWPALAAAALLALALTLHRQHRLLRRLENGHQLPPNPGQGVWNALESALYR